MNRKIKYWVISFIILPCALIAQNDLTGIIIDFDSKIPIPYATIELPSINSGTIADSLGVFEIELPDTCKEITLVSSSLGYKSVSIKFDLSTRNKKELEIKLEKRIYSLDEVAVSPSLYSTKELGILERRSKYDIFGVIGVQHGILIENSSGKLGLLDKVSFYINKHGYPNCPFRIRIYRFDKEKNKPRQDILNENLIVRNPTRGNNWFTIDVSSFNIEFPKEGIFIAMQWINSGNNYSYPVDFGKYRHKDEYAIRYGPILGFSKSNYSANSWYRYLGYPWKHFKGKSQPMIKATVKVPK